MNPLQDEQSNSSTPPPSVNFRQELREILREFGCKLIDVDLVNHYPNPQEWFNLKLGLWILDRLDADCRSL